MLLIFTIAKKKKRIFGNKGSWFRSEYVQYNMMPADFAKDEKRLALQNLRASENRSIVAIMRHACMIDG